MEPDPDATLTGNQRRTVKFGWSILFHGYRQQKAKPLVDQFFEWNREQPRRLDLVPGNPAKHLAMFTSGKKSYRFT